MLLVVRTGGKMALRCGKAKPASEVLLVHLTSRLVSPAGIEPTLLAPEANALSAELRGPVIPMLLVDCRFVKPDSASKWTLIAGG